MEKLTLEHIAPYLPYGLKGILTTNREDDFSEYDFDFEKFKKGVIWNYIGYAEGNFNIPMGEGEIDGFIYGHENTYVNFQYGIKPILRPMDLTKPITIDGKEIIPIVELAKIAFEGIEFENWLQGDRAISKEIEKSKRIRFWYLKKDQSFQTTLCGKQHVTNQIVLFQWLFKHKFDVFGLIEKGLAIDVNTLETNPYN